METLKTFYHVWCNFHWRDVVTEQLTLMRSVGLTDISAGVIGSPDEIEWVRAQGVDVIATSDNSKEYEALTLVPMHNWCKANAGSFVLYCHTKGVSVHSSCHPWYEARTMHRQLMMKHTVANWRQNVEQLQQTGADAIGVGVIGNIHNGRVYGNFEGNIYIARTDYIARLPELKQYQQSMKDKDVMGCHGERLACQTWHAQQHGNFISLVCSNKRLWEFETVSKYI